MIHNFFSTPIYIDADQDNTVESELSSIIPRLEFKNDWQPHNDTANTTFIPNKQTNIIEDYKLLNTKKLILKHVKKYLNDAQQSIEDEYQIVESWLNIFEKDNNIGLHEHGYQPNTVSGVYYHKADKDCGMISFKSPNPFVISFPHRCEQYSNIVRVPPEQGMIILFPSWLQHKVEPNRSDNERISLSFNIEFIYR